MESSNAAAFRPSPVAMPPPEISTSVPCDSSSLVLKRKRDDADDRSDCPSLGTRPLSRASSSSVSSRQNSLRSLSRTTRRHVLSLYEDDEGRTRCWNCEAAPCEVAHIIAKGDPKVRDFQKQGLLCFKDLDDENNLIPFCPTCHVNFDDFLRPGFVILPADINYFIAWEERDFGERQKEYIRTGKWRRRRLPTRAEHQQHCSNELGFEVSRGGAFIRYALRDFYSQGVIMHPGANPYPDQKEWHGYPDAALLRGFLAMLQTPARFPNAVYGDLVRLYSMYSYHERTVDLHGPFQLPRHHFPFSDESSAFSHMSTLTSARTASSSDTSGAAEPAHATPHIAPAKDMPPQNPNESAIHAASPKPNDTAGQTGADPPHRDNLRRKRRPRPQEWPTPIAGTLEWANPWPHPLSKPWKYGPSSTSASAMSSVTQDGQQDGVRESST